MSPSKRYSSAASLNSGVAIAGATVAANSSDRAGPSIFANVRKDLSGISNLDGTSAEVATIGEKDEDVDHQVNVDDDNAPKQKVVAVHAHR